LMCCNHFVHTIFRHPFFIKNSLSKLQISELLFYVITIPVQFLLYTVYYN
jgi:hypothetical protein